MRRHDQGYPPALRMKCRRALGDVLDYCGRSVPRIVNVVAIWDYLIDRLIVEVRFDAGPRMAIRRLSARMVLSHADLRDCGMSFSIEGLVAMCWREELHRRGLEIADAARELSRPEGRARELLLQHLTPKQRASFEAKGFFRVQGGVTGRWYRIRAARTMNVEVMGMFGLVKGRLCFMPRNVPLCDQLLAQKVALEVFEERALEIAHEF